jgi:hypothetical protein
VTIEILGALYAREACFKKEEFFQLISTLFCEEKTGFFRPLNRYSFELNYLV